jgi:hypothetical protein
MGAKTLTRWQNYMLMTSKKAYLQDKLPNFARLLNLLLCPHSRN